MTQRALLIVSADQPRGWDLGEQFDADGYTIYLAHDRASAIARLATHAVDVMILGALEHPAEAPALLRDLRAGELHARVHPGQPVVTIWAADDVSALRAYDAGSDHHLATMTTYLVLRAVIAAVMRRTLEPLVREQLRIGPLRIDLAARTLEVDGGGAVRVTNVEFELLRHLASDPARVFAKQELIHAVWGRRGAVNPRTVDSHVARLSTKLAAAGASGVLLNTWGVGWRLVAPIEP